MLAQFRRAALGFLAGVVAPLPQVYDCRLRRMFGQPNAAQGVSGQSERQLALAGDGKPDAELPRAGDFGVAVAAHGNLDVRVDGPCQSDHPLGFVTGGRREHNQPRIARACSGKNGRRDRVAVHSRDAVLSQGVDAPQVLVDHHHRHVLRAQSLQYHAADAPGPRNYVLAGAAEWPDGTRYPDGIIAYGDASAQGLSRKVGFVLDLLEQRTLALSANWRAATAVQVYTAHEIGALIEPHFVPRGLVQLGIDWHVCRPPVEGLEFEVDVRCVRRELVID